jgi:hypothetical protein
MNNKTAHACQKIGSLKWLGEQRDGLLVCAAVVYGLGYLVWSFHALTQDLGVLPALESQYFEAGVPPALLLLLGYLFIQKYDSIQGSTGRLVDKMNSWQQWVVVALLMVAIAVDVLFVSHLQTATLTPWDPQFWGVGVKSEWLWYQPLPILFGYTTLFTLVLTFLLVLGSWSPENNRGFFRLYRVSMTSMIVFILLIVYLKLFPELPQQLGGVKPQCARFDLAIEDLSPQTLGAFVTGPITHRDTTQKTVRSRDLDVLFSSDRFLLVRFREAGSRVYRLESSVVRARELCGLAPSPGPNP